MKLEDRVRISSDVMARRVGGEVVLLDLASGTYFGLDAIGAVVWAELEAGRTLAEACDAVLAAHEAERAQVESDVLELAGELERRRLVEPQ